MLPHSLHSFPDPSDRNALLQEHGIRDMVYAPCQSSAFKARKVNVPISPESLWAWGQYLKGLGLHWDNESLLNDPAVFVKAVYLLLCESLYQLRQQQRKGFLDSRFVLYTGQEHLQQDFEKRQLRDPETDERHGFIVEKRLQAKILSPVPLPVLPLLDSPLDLANHSLCIETCKLKFGKKELAFVQGVAMLFRFPHALLPAWHNEMAQLINTSAVLLERYSDQEAKLGISVGADIQPLGSLFFETFKALNSESPAKS